MSHIDDLLYSLRRQYPTGVTTMGTCSRGCGKPARGGAVCKACLSKELAELGASFYNVLGYMNGLDQIQQASINAEEFAELIHRECEK